MNQGELRQHPLSAAFPAMPPAEIEALAMDIEAHGQREPGVLLDGMVLDGWHRYLACGKAGAQFKHKDFDGDDPVAFVISRNSYRRHLTSSQRAAAIALCVKWKSSGENQHTGGGGEVTSPPLSNEEMAKVANTSERTIQQAKRAVEAGLGEAVRDGQMSAETAAKIATGRPEKSATKPKVIAADPKFEKLYVEVKNELAGTKEALAEMADLAASAKAFEEKAEFKEMQVLRAELRSAKRRRDELMAENAQLKTEVKRWRTKAEGGKK
jgi:hypothetical protein